MAKKQQLTNIGLVGAQEVVERVAMLVVPLPGFVRREDPGSDDSGSGQAEQSGVELFA